MSRGVAAASLVAITSMQLRIAHAEEPPPPPPAPVVPATEPAPPPPTDAPGEPAQPTPGAAHVPLVEANERLVITYRWPRWIPWTVFGGGFALAGIGVLMQYSASNLSAQYDQAVASECAVNGCNLSNPQTPQEQEIADRLNEMRDRAQTRNRIAVVTLVGASAAIVTGIVLVVMNKPTAHKIKVDLVPAEGGASASVGWQF